MMKLETERFGVVEIEPDDILLFPQGLLAFDDLRHWVLLADDHNGALAWLQSVARPDVAFAVMSPRRVCANYRVQLKGSQLAGLELEQEHQTFVLTLLNHEGGQTTANLRAPLLINLDRRLGRQVVTSDEQPIRFVLTGASAARRAA
jgi:flagellar assembly factor FliW